MSGIDPVVADELVVRAASPVRILQYRYHPARRRAELNPNPWYSPYTWGRFGTVDAQEGGRWYAQLIGGSPASVWFTANLPALPQGVSSRGLELVLHLRAAPQPSRVFVEADWIRGGRVMGQELAEVAVSEAGAVHQYSISLDEPDGIGGAEQVRILVRQAGDDPAESIHVFGAHLVVSDYHCTVQTPVQKVHLLPIAEFVRDFTRFDVLLENPIGHLVPGGVRYKTELRSIQLRRRRRAARGRIQFAALSSTEGMRHLRVWVSGENLDRSELLVRNRVNGSQQVVPLQSEETEALFWFLPEHATMMPQQGRVIRCPVRTMVERFVSTVQRAVVLQHSPWIDQQQILEEVAATGSYDPNQRAMDIQQAEMLIRTGNAPGGAIRQGAVSEWSLQYRALEGGDIVYRPVVAPNSTGPVPISWRPGGWQLPSEEGVLVFPVRGRRVRWDQVLVRVNGQPVRSVFADRAGFSGREDDHDGYLLVEVRRVSSVELVEWSIPPAAWLAGGAATQLQIRFGLAVGYLPATEKVVPLRVEAVLHGLKMPPGALATSSVNGLYLVRRERLQPATEERVGSYSSWVTESPEGSRQYVFSGERPIYMLQYYPILVKEGSPQITLWMVTPTLETQGSQQVLVDKEVRLHPNQYRLCLLYTSPSPRDS